jgi:hypothetical protein
VIYPTNEIEMTHLRMNGCAGRALPSKWSIQSSQTIKIDHSSPSKAVGDGVRRVVGGLGDRWRVADKLRANSYKIEGRKRNVALATDVKFDPGKATFVGIECGEGIGETGWALVE